MRTERMTTPFWRHLLRHGAVEPNGRRMGRTDCAPTAEGITACVSQAAELAVETLIASDRSRPRSAGEGLSAALHVPLTVDSRRREPAFGQWDGKATGDIDWEAPGCFSADPARYRSEEQSSELQSLMRIAYAVFPFNKHNLD